MRLRNIPGAKAAITGSSYVVQNPEEWKGKWKQCFTKEQPLHIEVGMGKGRFLMDMASLHPEINYVGVEMYDSVLLRALQKRERMEADGEKLDNLKQAWNQQQQTLATEKKTQAEIIGKEEKEEQRRISSIKAEYEADMQKELHSQGADTERRLTSREFLARYSQILTTGETVEFKTDNKDLFEFSLEEVTEAEGWTLLAHTFDLHHQEDMMVGNVMTEYEEKFSSMGNPICKLIARCEE